MTENTRAEDAQRGRRLLQAASDTREGDRSRADGPKDTVSPFVWRAL